MWAPPCFSPRQSCATEMAPEVKRPNVLFLAMDDLRPEIGAYGATYMQTPAIDSLAQTGVAFTRAYAQRARVRRIPRQHVDRAAADAGRFLTFQPPGSTKTHRVFPRFPAWFKQAGYTTISLGKVSHHADDGENSWSEPPWNPENESLPGYRGWRNYLEREGISARTCASRKAIRPHGRNADVDDDAYFDGRVAKRAVEFLQKFEQDGTPFFLAVGFVKPRLPFNAPRKYWDLYPEDSVSPAANRLFPEKAPQQAWHNWGDCANTRVCRQGDAPVSDEMASGSWSGDYAPPPVTPTQLVGRVLNELERLGLAESTIVVLWGDHGWSLGEHGLWAKHSPFNLATRIPLIVRAPGATAGYAPGLVANRWTFIRHWSNWPVYPFRATCRARVSLLPCKCRASN